LAYFQTTMFLIIMSQNVTTTLADNLIKKYIETAEFSS
jgi:hypothetical protein